MSTLSGRVDRRAGFWILGAFLALAALVAASRSAAASSVLREAWHEGRGRDVPPVFVSIVSHNEEPSGYPNFVADESAFWLHRAGVVAFAQVLAEEGVAYNFQSDWNFLEAAVLYDTGTPETNGKNFLRYLREDLGFETDPHAHETQFNYADVARFMDLLGVTPSQTAGGLIADPPEQSKLEYLWQPLTATLDPAYVWEAEILWGGATHHHVGEEHLWISGIWRPRDNEHFREHDPAAPLPHVGGYWNCWEGLHELIAKQQSGVLEEGKIYTQTIFVGQTSMLHTDFIESFRAEIGALAPHTQSGDLLWVGLEEVVDIWETVYGGEANLYPYLQPPDSVYYEPEVVHDVDLLPSGHLLVTDGGAPPLRRASGIYEIDRDGLIHWSYDTGLTWAHNGDQLPNGDVLLSDSGNDRVLLVSAAGEILWNTDEITLSDGSVLRYPNDANLLYPSMHRLITDRDNHRVIEIDETGTILWQFGVTGEPGGDSSHLSGPHNADRLQSGNTIIADSNNNRILEVDASGAVVWAHGGNLDWPRDADRLPTGTTLITDSGHHRIVEVDAGHGVVWSYDQELHLPYDADRLPGGNTLISSGARILEVDPAGLVVWEYAGPVTYEEIWIHNPTSGVDLYCHVHYPSSYDSTTTYPGVVLIPGGVGTGTSFDQNDLAQRYADAGLIVMHFDPDGRGLSTNGGTYTEEDYNGFLHQDGLREVFQYLVDLNATDDENCGMFSSSYGVTMAAGTLARYPQDPPSRFLLDFEGPHNRTLTAAINGGHIPHDTSDVVFWREREADRFMPEVVCRYLRLQTELDHNPHAVGNPHAIALINAATSTWVGGEGQSPWTRVNDETLNDPNRIYTLAHPPVWLSEGGDTFPYRLALLLELVGPEWSALRTLPRVARAGTRVTAHPNPFAGGTRFELQVAATCVVDLDLFDVTGRWVCALHRGRLARGRHQIDWDGRDAGGRLLPAGIYHVLVNDQENAPTAERVVVLRAGR